VLKDTYLLLVCELIDLKTDLKPFLSRLVLVQIDFITNNEKFDDWSVNLQQAIFLHEQLLCFFLLLIISENNNINFGCE
jgi:hypothetical protein